MRRLCTLALLILSTAPALRPAGPVPQDEFLYGATVYPEFLTPKQTTRMLKCECPACGYTVRTTRKWLDIAVPTCPVCLFDLEEAA